MEYTVNLADTVTLKVYLEFIPDNIIYDGEVYALAMAYGSILEYETTCSIEIKS